MEKINLEDIPEKLPSNVKCIDELMNGGLEPGIITEIYGQGGSGKTNISMIFARSVLLSGKRVIYIDTEGFSTERFSQVCPDKSLYKNMVLFRASSIDDQDLAIIRSEKLMKEKNYSLLILDSLTSFFRIEKGNDISSRMSGFEKELGMLNNIAVRYNIPVLLTNQIYEDIDKKSLEPFGGFFIDHSMKAIYKLEKINNKRRIEIVKHRSIKEGLYTTFIINDSGISCE
ncbi:DNA repair and recombination protein RadB [Picrophilus oshimae]|uniref:DNA repair and recombination protein RadB n=1 Tax=Picrophilus torridus (strain ATCC 700027 / DSM 9790 / JCM 10055 / NBRC 100828 / KAW 2/3) TaxID=1122961 RepID=A0A8G2L8L2_PICTO|nr:DNA repair and recombination protein RadB [Picrophilus oshimae]SMD31575.1 DNA repair protein RadB [Picrophilus oshimae DSM 9789]